MRTSSLCRLGLLLAGCAAPDAALPVVISPAPPSVLRPSDWGVEVSQRLAATALRPVETPEGQRLWSRSQGIKADLHADGAQISPRYGGDAVGLCVAAWGREDDLRAVNDAPVELGDCAATGLTDVDGRCLRRVEQDFGGIVSWWEGREDGIEHGLDLTPPEGAGLVVVELVARGASVEVVADGGVRLTAGDWALRYEDLGAWDARGVALPTWAEPTSDGLRLVVDVADAVGRVTVDPVLRTDPLWHDSPTPPGGGSDVYEIVVADVNGDAFEDLVVSAALFDQQAADEGVVFVYHGTPTGLPRQPDTELDPFDETAHFGSSLADAGDVDGDGYEDILVGAPFLADRSGAAWVFHGTAAGLDPVPAWIAPFPRAPGRDNGFDLQGVGDVNGDGYDDVVTPVQEEHEFRGSFYVYLGSPTGLADVAAWSMTGEGDDRVYATGGGDVNGDGIDDLVIRVEHPNPNRNDDFFYSLAFGDVSGVMVPATWDGAPSAARTGARVLIVPDVNADGVDEVLMGAPGAGDDYPEEGVAWAWYGGPGGPGLSPDWHAAPADQAGAYFSYAMCAADVNGDGVGDVLATAHNFSTARFNSEGRAWLFLGAPGNLLLGPSWDADPVDQLAAGFGTDCAGGDINDDGFDDVVFASGQSGAPGALWLFTGCGGLPEVVGNLIDEDCDSTIACFHDGDGDGYVDANRTQVISPNLSCDDEGEALNDLAGPDCDDAHATVHAGAVEEVGNALDEDCDGRVQCYVDADQDGYGADSLHQVLSEDADCADPGELVLLGARDCDDTNATVSPGVLEVPNNRLDDDCVGGDQIVQHPATVGTEPEPEAAKGCGCDQRGGSGAWVVVVLAGLRRRRR